MRLAALVLGAVLLAGCGAEPPALKDVPGGGPEPSAPATPAYATDTPDPTGITIPAIDAHSSLIPLGLTDDCDYSEPPCLDPPPLDEPMQAGWYAGRDPAFDKDEYQPGEVGPAVIAGHVDGYGPDGSKGHPGIFKRLGELKPGDEILIDRGGAPQLRFVVASVGSFPKKAFPSEDVYGPTSEPELRLITCGGSFDASSGHYVDNIVVWAVLA